ncbi:MAG: response regulator [Gemmataceae bacterium]|nr:response regulator [Gemmataceae bacterium]
MLDFLSRLFDSSDFTPRSRCGGFGSVPGVLPLHLVSDVAIWLAYLAIPAVLLFFVLRKRTLPFRAVFVLFGLFIVACGFTHFMEAVLVYDPLYRLAAAVKLVTAVVSWLTVIALVPVVPQVLALRSPQELEREIAERKRAEQALEEERQGLEERVGERTAELARANDALQSEIAWRQKAQEEAERANRVKDDFLATLSHELRTPLNALLGWTHLLRSGKLDAATTARGLEVLDRNTRAQAQLIDDLLDVSRIVTGKLRIESKPVDLAGVLQAALDTVRPAAGAKGVALSLRAEGPCLTTGDAMRLQQVAWNLLSNAVKFTPRGGRVEAGIQRVGTWWELRVRDDGSGIDPDLLPHVFERFRQGDSSTTRQHGGLGLGLAIVRHLVELHGGTVSAESDGEGRGAAFRVLLPVAAVAPAQAEAPPVPLGEIRGLRVLVVDDEADAREMVSFVLAGAGAEVRTCAGAEEALACLDGFAPDVLVSDIGMPGQDGYALLRQVRERGSLVPAVALTAFARAEDRMRALAAGFQMHAAKPIDPAALAHAVRALAGWRMRE